MVYILSISEEVRKLLDKGILSSKDKGFSKRCQAVVLSSKGFCSKEIAKICDMKSKKTVCRWLNKFKKDGIEALYSKPGRGRKSVMSCLSIVQTEVLKKR